jgi:hypothetical protein
MATVVTASYGGEGTSSGSRADVCFFVSVPRAYKNMVGLLPLAAARLYGHNGAVKFASEGGPDRAL